MSEAGFKGKALVLGAAGFVGAYLCSYLAAAGFSVYGTKLEGEVFENSDVREVFELNVLDKESMLSLFKHLKPDYIFYLAAQSSVGLSWKMPELTLHINVEGTAGFLEAVRQAIPECRVLMVGSGEEYGFIMPEDIPVKESLLPRPGNIYAVSKNTQNQLASVYARAYGLAVFSTRSFNHIGPGQQLGFVVPDFCRQIARIEAGLQPPLIKVGNLSAKRDFCDVKDIVAAYALLAEKAVPGETYNIGQGKSVAVEEILKILLGLSKANISLEQDPAKMRPSDVPNVYPDISKLQNATGWEAVIPLEETLAETLDYWRQKVKEEK